MDIDENQIASKELVGWLDQDPVYEVEGKGGRSWIVALRKNRLVTLGVGPHIAVTRSIARKIGTRVRWTQLQKSDRPVDEGGRIFLKYLDVTERIRTEQGE